MNENIFPEMLSFISAGNVVSWSMADVKPHRWEARIISPKMNTGCLGCGQSPEEAWDSVKMALAKMVVEGPTG